MSRYEIGDLQIRVRGRLRVQVLSSEHAHFENFRPPNLKRVLVLVVVLVLQSEARYSVPAGTEQKYFPWKISSTTKMAVLRQRHTLVSRAFVPFDQHAQ